MAEEKKLTIEKEKTVEKVAKAVEAKEVIKAKPLPVDKEKTKEIEEKLAAGKPIEDAKAEDKKVEEKKPAKKEAPKLTKKEFAEANGKSVPISKKHAMYICRFIKNKPIDKAIEDLTQVLAYKKSVPMRGEIPHRKGPGGSGRYPINAAKHFITILKGLKGNVMVNQMEIENTRIVIASASWASRPARKGNLYVPSNFSAIISSPA